MSSPLETSQPFRSQLFRIGTVSKAAGVPVSTLRIWEARYGAFKPVKTAGNQRLFQEHDVSKALLLKKLANQGHAISAIASLNLDQLRRMSESLGIGVKPPLDAAGPLKLAIVGLGLANRIESQNFSAGATPLLVTDVLEDLSQAANASFSSQAQVLLIKVNTLQMSVHSAVQSLLKKHPFSRAIVLYHFAAEAVVKAIKATGVIVRREPLSDSELLELIQSVRFVDPARAQEFGTSLSVIPTRKYSDATLARMASISTNVLCECPKHVAELISQLASFEEYSQECLNQNADDAHLHAYLRSISGSARSLFESALEKIAAHEGINLSEVPV